jgi:hypothetical protein
MPEVPHRSCDICGGPLVGRLAAEGVCSGCEHHGAIWAHRQIARLWELGLPMSAIGDQLGYSSHTVGELVKRLRRRGVHLKPRKAVPSG